MNVQFLEPAQAEFTEAVKNYNAHTEGLGFEFSDEVKATSESLNTLTMNALKLGPRFQKEQGAAGRSAFHTESSIGSGAIPCS